MKNEMRKFLTVLPLIGLVVGVSACREELNPGVDPTPSDGKTSSIKVCVGGSSSDTKAGKKAKSAVVREMIPIPAAPGEPALFLEESTCNLDDCYFSAPATKGKPIYTENFGEEFGTFGAIAYGYESVSEVATPTAVTLTEFVGKSKSFSLKSEPDASPLLYAYDFKDDNKDWKSTTPKNLLFFLSAPDQTAGLNSGVKTLTYKYTSKYTVGETTKDFVIKNDNNAPAYNGVIEFTYESPATAAEQKDILFTSKSISQGSYHEYAKDKSSVLFYHTLAGVKFKAGNFGDGVTTIESIVLKNIMTTGTCTVTPLYDAEGYVVGDSNKTASTKKSAAVSKWTNVGTLKDFTLDVTEVNSAYTGTGDNKEKMFPDAFYGSDAKNDLGVNNFMDEDFTKVFFFVPQTTSTASGSKCEIVIKYTVEVDDHVNEYEKTIDFSGRTWEAGVLYTYTITGKGLNVYITDSMGSTESGHTTKSGVEITNTGNCNAYMRVAIVANWFDNHEYSESSLTPGHVITNTAWDIDDEIANGKLVINSNWSKGNDGFFYYHHQVKGGATISQPIFASYTGHDIPTGAHLEMDLAVQAIDASKLETDSWPAAWDDALGLDKKVDDGTTIK